jgi:hypothetical protein
VATTLQALELTNGSTLAGWLQRGAANLLQQGAGSPRELVLLTYRRALGRPPTAVESELGEAMVGTPAAAAGVEDFLWAVAMLPEFQLID